MGNQQAGNNVQEFDAIVVGAGFGGMYMLHKLREEGFTAKVIEAGTDVGGTWYWNRYPGARCDVESLDYQYGFSDELQREWNWTERYAAQPEILEYANWVADKLDLRRDIQFKTRVETAIFDDASSRWTVTTDGGETYSGQYCVMATGCLSVPRKPEFPGLESFKGNVYHTGEWPHDGVDFSGQTMAVIGTGSSGIQSIPIFAEQAEHVTIFQRTPNFSLPAHNHNLPPERVAEHKEQFLELRRQAREGGFGSGNTEGQKMADEMEPNEAREHLDGLWDQGGFGVLSAFKDIFMNQEANDHAAEYVRSKIKEQVSDPDVAETLAPKTYPLGTKRPCVDTGYYDVYNRDNVTLVDINQEPIEGMTKTGIKTSGREVAVDSIVMATGFDAMTGALLKMDIRGRNGQSLRAKWEHGPRTYLGLSMAGFPNLFVITGPGSPSVLANMIMAIEQHVEWMVDCMVALRKQGVSEIEATVEAEDAWVDHVNEVANVTLYPKANSWYIGANIPGKPRVFMPYIGGMGPYTHKCNEVAANGYEGFALTGAKEAAAV